MELQNTGWRRMAPAPAKLYEIPHAEKKDLFRAARLATAACELMPKEIAVLNQLVGFFGGEAYHGRFLVWPSNKVLCDRTGLCERAVRYAIASLINRGLLGVRLSANGKRHPVQSDSGQIVDAYGFDLSPLLARFQELEAEVARRKEIARQHGMLHDELTVARRQARQAIEEMEARSEPVGELWGEFQRLMRLTPRRSSPLAPDAALAGWRALRDQAEERFYAASDGNSCRHIEDNKNSPDQPCNKRLGMNGRTAATLSLTDLVAACPDAFGYAGSVENLSDLVREAPRLAGGTLGASRDAWHEACKTVGPTVAAATVFMALQIYDRDQHGPRRIQQPGGWWRAYVRKVAGGQLDLLEEIAAMRRRRHH